MDMMIWGTPEFRDTNPGPVLRGTSGIVDSGATMRLWDEIPNGPKDCNASERHA